MIIAYWNIETVTVNEGLIVNSAFISNERQRTLLLVDDEINILSSLKRLLRRDGYNILQANSGQEGLDLLSQNEVDVIVSDQRMPGMSGVEFLREVKKIYPDTVRIVLSGYTELQSVTDAINEGSIYKFLTKPWEDNLLREHIEDAFKHKALIDENSRLSRELKISNQELAAANRKLEALLDKKEEQIARDTTILKVIREVLQHVPVPILGIDEDKLVVFYNSAAQDMFQQSSSILGMDANHLIPEWIEAVKSDGMEHACSGSLHGKCYRVVSHAMGNSSHSRGQVLIFTEVD
jgi:FixJ family two-component response regulator